MLSSTESRFASGPGLWSGHSASISSSRGAGRPRRATSILKRSRAFRDCHAASGTTSSARSTRNRPSDWTTSVRPSSRASRSETAERYPLRSERPELLVRQGGALLVSDEPRELEPGAGLGRRVPEVAPDPHGLLEPVGLADGLRRCEHAQLERLREGGAVAPHAGGGRRRGRVTGGGAAVAARELDPAGREQGVHLVHPGRAGEGTLHERGGGVRLVRHEHARQAGEGRDERLQVARRLAVADRLLERRPGERPLAAGAVDLAELLERVGDHARAEPLVEVAGPPRGRPRPRRAAPAGTAPRRDW